MKLWLRTLAIFIIFIPLILIMWLDDASGLPDGKINVIAVTSRYEVPGPPGGRKGDGERLYWSIRDRYGRTIGIAVFDCRWVLRQKRLCYGELKMPLGKISLLGASETRSLGEFSVVGGTGRYNSASGAMTFTAIGLRRMIVSVVIT